MSESNGKPTTKAQPKPQPELPPDVVANIAATIYGENITNRRMLREEWLRRFLDPRRDLDQECGYAKTADLTADKYKDLYDREPVATRIVEVYPTECWQRTPEVYEDEDNETETEFETAWDELNRSLLGNSYYQDEEGSPIWEYLERVDIMSGIGHYGVLFLGLDDGKSPEEPVAGWEKGVPKNPNPYGKTKLLYLRVFDESQVTISTRDRDPKSPRYGQPEIYQITIDDPSMPIGLMSDGNINGSVDVHWSRILHVAESPSSNEWTGVPRIRPCYNPLYNLMKIYGGSGEGYWKGAFQTLSIEMLPAGIDGEDTPKPDVPAIKEALERIDNSLQRHIVLDKMTAKTLAPVVTDPTPSVNVHIQAICIKLACPIRIFMGSERGELSSSQDSDEWAKRCYRRCCNYITPKIIVPFVDRLIKLGVLPTPAGFSVCWPDVYDPTPDQIANTANLRTTAMSSYVAGGLNVLIAPMDYLTRELKYTQDEAETILENTLDHMAEAHPDATVAVPGAPPQYPEPQGPIAVKEGDKLVDGEGNTLATNELEHLVELINNAFFNHAGRPGKKGGSQPRYKGRFISQAGFRKIQADARRKAFGKQLQATGIADRLTDPRFATKVAKNVVNEIYGKKSKAKVSQRVTAWGTQGSSDKAFHLSFKSEQSLNRWAANNKAKIHGMEREKPPAASTRFQDRLATFTGRSVRVLGVVGRDLAAPAVASVMMYGAGQVLQHYGIGGTTNEDVSNVSTQDQAYNAVSDEMAQFFNQELTLGNITRDQLEALYIALGDYLNVIPDGPIDPVAEV